MFFFLFQLFFGSSSHGEIVFPNATVQVEVADDYDEQRRGLMSRIYMPLNHGMIFVFKDEKTRTFWMRNTLLPLDMIFLDNRQYIVDIKKNVQPCRKNPCPLYSSKKPAKYVLEMNAGSAERLGLRENGSARIILSPL